MRLIRRRSPSGQLSIALRPILPKICRHVLVVVHVIEDLSQFSVLSIRTLLVELRLIAFRKILSLNEVIVLRIWPFLHGGRGREAAV